MLASRGSVQGRDPPGLGPYSIGWGVWAAAADRGASRGRRWPYYAIGGFVGADAAVTGVLVAATHSSPHAHRHGPVFVIVFAAVVAVVVAAMVVWSLRRQLNRPTMKRLRCFSFSQRRAAMRAVNSGATLTGEQQTIAHTQLEQLGSASARTKWAMPVAVITFVVLAIADVAGLRGLWAAISVLELLSVTASVLLLRPQKRRLERALARSPHAAG